MGGACSRDRDTRDAYRILTSLIKRPLRTPMRWEDNIKIDLGKVGD